MGGMTQRLAILSFQIDAAVKAVRLLPAGQFRSGDGSGRPNDVPAWYIDSGLAAQLIARANTRSDRKVIDYEHQTLKAAENGHPAPAAGWISALEWRAPAESEPGGLYMIPEWTGKAAAMIAANEYRYISPVFTYDDQGRVLDLLHAGLTNFAGLDGLTDLAALSAHFNLSTKEESMKKLLEALGLSEGATEDQAIAALKALTDANAAQAGTIAALKAQAPDPAKYVPIATVTDLQSQVAALTAEKIEREVGELVEVGMSDGRILPSMESWARDLGKKDAAALKGFLDNAKPLDALKGTQSGGKQPGGNKSDGVLSESQLAVCKAMGISLEDFKTTIADQD